MALWHSVCVGIYIHRGTELLYFQNVVLALDSSSLDIDQVENLVKFCPTKEEMTMLKLIAEKMPELLDFDKDLVHLEVASKIQLKSLAKEMQALSKGLKRLSMNSLLQRMMVLSLQASKR
ncbi:Formin-like protein 3 [Camellia lanceoleosa]|uniref:Formin-like protein 3 n=1 Tax=Camellia lanceoleosa TaxID=1840588 RepID=A0ACC0H198_9ERIC|nr:Formin-like protein 3 [Camellia lanceoleosa]